jgi:hypothetical protein
MLHPVDLFATDPQEQGKGTAQPGTQVLVDQPHHGKAQNSLLLLCPGGRADHGKW